MIRTSLTHPLRIAEVPAAPGAGRIGITFCPGKHDAAAATGAWARDLRTDLDAITAWGARAVLTLVEPAELVALKVPDLGAAVRARGLFWWHLPIPDYSVPGPAFERAWAETGPEIRALLRSGADVVIHCKGGLGRAGMIAARLLAEMGTPALEAIRAVRRARPGAIETPSQLARVRETAALTETTVIDTAQMARVGGQLGSNPGGLFEDAQGLRFYVKEMETAAMARNERLAARLYRLAGAPTLTYLPCRRETEVGTLFVPLERRSAGKFTPEERAQAQRWFGVHAWTANWDAVGFSGDNQGVRNGVVLTLDLGGALAFRACGDPKGKAFGPEVDEIDRMRHDPDNRAAMQLFGDMTPEALHAAIARVTRLSDAAICAAVDAEGVHARVAQTLIARKEDMARRAP